MTERRRVGAAIVVAVSALVLAALGWAPWSADAHASDRRTPAAVRSDPSPVRATPGGTRLRDRDPVGRPRLLRGEVAAGAPGIDVAPPFRWSRSTTVTATARPGRSELHLPSRGPPLLLQP